MKSLVIASVLFLSLSSHAQDAKLGQAKYVSCTACHGAQGQGGVGPRLAGQKAEEIVKKLTAYKNKQQVGSQSQLMWGIAAGLSSADIANIATYTASLK